MTEPRIAKTVVADASKGDDAFMVDGERFPWYISEEGPTARKVLDDLYLVHVVILATCVQSDERPEGFWHGGLPNGGGWPQPVLLGVEFPWYISEDGITYRCSGNTVPTVELEFFAESVEGIEVTDQTEPADGKVRESSGYVIARTA